MSDREICAILNKVRGYARKLAAGRLDPDDVESEVGLAVTLALRESLDTATPETFACTVVKRAIYKLITDKERRPVNADAASFARIPAPSQDVPKLTARELAEGGASIRTIRAASGVTERAARRLVSQARGAAA